MKKILLASASKAFLNRNSNLLAEQRIAARLTAADSSSAPLTSHPHLRTWVFVHNRAKNVHYRLA